MTEAVDHLDTIFSRDESVIRREVGGETVLVPVHPSGAADVEYLYRTNAVGAAVWGALDGRATLREVVARIREGFDLSDDTAADVEADVIAYLADMEEAGLVVRADSSESAPSPS